MQLVRLQQRCTKGCLGDEVNKGVMLAKPEENKGEGQRRQ